MNVQKLNEFVRRCGKTKGKIATDSGVSRMTLDNALQGGDIRVSILEAIAHAVGVRVGDLFDDGFSPPNIATASGGSVAAINSEVNAPQQERIAYLEGLLREKERLIQVLLDKR